MIVSQGLGWSALLILFFFSLFLAYQRSWKTHTLASLYFLPSHNHKPSLQPQSAFGSCDTERMAHVVKCAGKFPVGPIQPSLRRRIWCQIAAVVLRPLSITLINPVSSFLSPSLSPPAVFFSFLFFLPPPPPFFLYLRLTLEVLWGRDHPFVLRFCLLPRSLPAWHNTNPDGGAK